MNKDYILNIQNLTFGYTKEQIIYHNFNLSMQVGQIISIVGSSGSGKSTLFELISGTLKPIRGKIESARLSCIFQDPYSSFHPSYSIIDQIDDVTSKRYKQKELDGMMKKLLLTNEQLSSKPHNLSGGQLQRCSILRALLMQPKLILADEPTSALDNITALETMKLLIEFLDQVGILLITHDEALASWCSDTIINIEKKD